MLSTTFPQEQEISLACNILRKMANDPKEAGSKSRNTSFESSTAEQAVLATSHVNITEEGRRVDGDTGDVWQDY